VIPSLSRSLSAVNSMAGRKTTRGHRHRRSHRSARTTVPSRASPTAP